MCSVWMNSYLLEGYRGAAAQLNCYTELARDQGEERRRERAWAVIGQRGRGRHPNPETACIRKFRRPVAGAKGRREPPIGEGVEATGS